MTKQNTITRGSDSTDKTRSSTNRTAKQAVNAAEVGRESAQQQVRNDAVGQLHQQYGNQAVQRWIRQRSTDESAGSSTEEIADRSISRAMSVATRGTGRRLGSPTRRQMESRFGHSFGGVRMYDDLAAKSAARGLDAAALTIGTDIIVGTDDLDPTTLDGQLLLAHELAHVVQHSNQTITGEAMVTEPGQRQEMEAWAAATDVLGGASPTIQHPSTALIARSTDEEIAGVLANLVGFHDKGLGFLKDIDEALPEDAQYLQGSGPEYMGTVFDAFGEGLGRYSEGQRWNAFGGMTARGGISALSQTQAYKQGVGHLGGFSRTGSGLGVVGSVLGMMGLSEEADIVNATASLVNPKALVGQGITEGMMSTYDTGVATVDMLMSGDTSQFQDLAERNLKGDSGQIIQGYSMMGEVGSELLFERRLGSRSSEIARRSASGELGGLPKVGAKLGDWMYDVFN